MPADPLATRPARPARRAPRASGSDRPELAMRYILWYIISARRQRPRVERTPVERIARWPAACLALLGLVSVPVPLTQGGPAAGPVAGEEVLVFAAASTGGALEEVAAAYAAAGGGRVRFSLAATSALARQVESGAPADLFLSANTLWMDRLEDDGLLAAGSRSFLFRNRLVLVAPQDTELEPVTLDATLDLEAMLDGGRLAIAEPVAVPAGIYARQALESLGLWERLRAHTAPASDVRHAALLVRRHEAPLGIVYWTDARATPGLRVLGAFSSGLHDPVAYWVAQLADAPAPAAAAAFRAFLQSDTARTIFSRHGFAPPYDADSR